MSLLATMSLMGSFGIALYYFIKLILRNYFSVKYKYALLKISLFNFVFPWPLLKNIFYSGNIAQKSIYIYADKVIQLDKKSVIFFDSLRISRLLINLIFIIWLFVVLYFLANQLINYFKLKKVIYIFSDTIRERETTELFNQLKNKYSVCKEVNIRQSSFINTPLVLGITKPTIFIPNFDFTCKELEMIIAHELLHIKRNDLLYRCICLLAIAIHWYNPFSYLLFNQIKKISECVCDEYYVSDLPQTARVPYANIILKIAIYGKENIFITSFSAVNSKKILKERIYYMLNYKKESRLMKFLSVAIVCIISLLCIVPVFAYEGLQVVEWKGSSQIKYTSSEEVTEALFEFGNGEAEPLNKKSKKQDMNIEMLSQEGIFYDMNGTSYTVNDKQANNNTKACVHSLDTGYYNIHKKYSDGSCTSEKYNAKFCTKCEKVAVYDLITSSYNKNCNH